MNNYVNVLDTAAVNPSVEKMTEEDLFGQSFSEYIENVKSCSLDDVELNVNDIDTSVFIIDDGGELFRTKSGEYINVCWRFGRCRVWVEDDPELIAFYDNQFNKANNSSEEEDEEPHLAVGDKAAGQWYEGLDDEGDTDYIEEEEVFEDNDDYINEKLNYVISKKIRIIKMDDPIDNKRYAGKEGIIQSIETDGFGDTQYWGTWGDVAVYPDYDTIEFIDNESLEEGLFDPEEENINYGHKAWVLNQIISSMNDETAYYDTEWLYIWPDGETEKECDEDFGDKESFEELEDTFKSIYKYNSADEDGGVDPEEAEYNFHRDGLYNPTKEAVEVAHEYDKKLGLEPIKVLGKVRESLNEDFEGNTQKIDFETDKYDVDLELFSADDELDVLTNNKANGEGTIDYYADILIKVRPKNGLENEYVDMVVPFGITKLPFTFQSYDEGEEFNHASIVDWNSEDINDSNIEFYWNQLRITNIAGGKSYDDYSETELTEAVRSNEAKLKELIIANQDAIFNEINERLQDRVLEDVDYASSEYEDQEPSVDESLKESDTAISILDKYDIKEYDMDQNDDFDYWFVYSSNIKSKTNNDELGFYVECTADSSYVDVFSEPGDEDGMSSWVNWDFVKGAKPEVTIHLIPSASWDSDTNLSEDEVVQSFNISKEELSKIIPALKDKVIESFDDYISKRFEPDGDWLEY